jgi:hypothetical protein
LRKAHGGCVLHDGTSTVSASAVRSFCADEAARHEASEVVADGAGQGGEGDHRRRPRRRQACGTGSARQQNHAEQERSEEILEASRQAGAGRAERKEENGQQPRPRAEAARRAPNRITVRRDVEQLAGSRVRGAANAAASSIE